jgi:hypothetical protein
MPTAVKLWQTALKQLQQLPKEGLEAGSGAETPYVLPVSKEFTTLPKASHAVWKQLIKELKVNSCLPSWLHISLIVGHPDVDCVKQRQDSPWKSCNLQQSS